MKRIVIIICFFTACTTAKKQQPQLTNRDISNVLTAMTDIMIHDITNPPLAARFFSYTCLAGYEVVSQNNQSFKSMHGRLNQYPLLQKPDSIKGYHVQLSAILAMLQTAQKLQPSGKMVQAYEASFIDSCIKAGFDEETMEQSKKYAAAVSKKILAYAKADRYNKISNYPRYTPLNKEGCWYPTPPAYIAAVEPYFNTVRPFTLDTCNQFIPAPPVAFSKDKSSPFYAMLLQNYKEGKDLPQEHRVVAAFWDCNPFAVQDDGHLQMSLKKISPGAHWLGISGIACAKANKSFEETMLIQTSVAIGLMDAFMCCWDEKFRSNRVRPETAIRQYIDPKWTPLLQTPPFPEYLSGHSVISAASATILTHYFGDGFAYTDSVEVSYGLPPRSFKSFHHAAEEAGVSRFYGGIHFMDAINNGREQGIKVGEWVISKLK
ncbi:vanadium-dependent haloperoxidase [Foetidibacter luteolus]|uniref:vanadium-dependent haloperoxidase n=1 Tax=Foetidibacter luteolus TaxID=2608880 RepID=UPI00129AEC23|nr:vanadium-dependent haloperoxidase [Foetidibacter luteolus]